MNNADIPITPIPDQLVGKDTVALGSKGLTKREHFAAMAMQGVIVYHHDVDLVNADVVKAAVNLADALLRELEK